MIKRISLRLGLLSGILFTGNPVNADIPLTPVSTASSTVPQTLSQASTSTNIKLLLEDLPEGFQELPPELTASLASQFRLLTQQFQEANLNPENLFAFVNPESFQIVLGFTSPLSEQDWVNFDTNVQQLQQPEIQQLLVSQLKQRLQGMGEINVLEYKPLPELNNVADTSTGFTLGIDMEGTPLQLDMATFRRGGMVAFTGVMYVNGQMPLIQVGDVAQKLDSRIVQRSAQSYPAGLANHQF
ncbi:hypothetical protein [Coleofasciculus chthonoplastes]|uniref:hypothetical protein n=1 Tax=Coleofasciculus chthonoplastes TaxID=64178 RepID=UPI0005C70AD6|nr:hypothetical protein [Coleofasciculus chthonoplastes]